MFYANIDDQGVCIGISSLTSTIDDSAYIEIPSYDQSYLRRKYVDGAWTGEVVALEDYKAEFIDTSAKFEDFEEEEPPPQEPREWRDLELQKTDVLILLPDHPDKDNLIAYRQELRDWPSTADFPDTKPTLGS